MRITGITVLSTIALYFLSVGTLREMAVKLAGTVIAQVVEQESDGFYGVTFDKIEIDLLRREVRFSNFRLNVDSVSRAAFEAGEISRENMYITHIPLLTLQIRSLYDLYLNKSLQVSAINLHQPDVKWYKNPKEEEEVTLSLEAGDFYQLITDYLNHFEITNFKIIEGLFTYIKNPTGLEQVYVVGPVNAAVENFEIGQEMASGADRFLNTDKLLLQISEQRVKLADSLHVVEFDDLSLSTETSEIVFTNLKLKPRVERLPVPDSVNSYEVFIPKFRLTNVDFIKAYNNNILEIGEIIFEDPSININEMNRKGAHRRNGDGKESASITDLLTSLFDVIEVKNFDLRQALLDLKFYGGKNQDRFTVQNASVVLKSFKIDTSTVFFSRDTKLFEHIDFTVDEYAYFLPDSIHRLFVKKFRFSTLDSIIRGDSLLIAPIEGLSQQWFAEKADMQKRFYVSSFQLSGVELWNGWENKNLVVAKLEISSSEFFLKRLNDPKNKISFREVANFYPHVKEIFSSIFVDSLTVEESEVDFYNREKRIFSSPRIKVFANSFIVDSLTQLDTSKFFHADDLVLQVGQSRLLFPDDSHILQIGDFNFNPIKGTYEVDNLTITPYRPSGWSADGNIRHMKMTGFYLKEFLVAGDWLADSVVLLRPDISINSFDARRRNVKASLGRVEVKNLDIEQGNLFFNLGDTTDFDLTNYSFSASDLGYELSDNSRWRIGEASTSIDMAKLTLPGATLVKVSDIRASLNDSTITTQRFSFSVPTSKGISKLETPGISISGLDILAAIKGDHLKWNKAFFGEAVVEWKIGGEQPASKKQLEQVIGDVKDRLLGGYSYVKGGEVNFPVELLSVYQDSVLRQVGNIELGMKGVYFNKQSSVASSPLGFAKDITLSVGQQDIDWLKGFDTFVFSDLQLSTQTKKLTLGGLRVMTGQRGNMVVATYTPRLKISGLDWQELLLNGRVLADTLQANLEFLTIDDKSTTKKAKGKKGREEGGAFKNIAVNYIDIDGDKLSYLNMARNRSWEIPSFDIELSGFLMDESEAMDKDQLLYSESYKVALDGIAFRLPDSLYRVQVDRLSISSQAPQIVIEGPTLLPLHGMYEHGNSVGHQSSWMQGKGREIALYDPNIFGLLQGDEFVASKVEISNVYMRMFRDKRLPFPADQVRGLPHLQLMEVALPIQIDSLVLIGSQIDYLEFAEDGAEPGQLIVADLNARGANITNKPSAIAKNPYANLHAQALMMEEGLLKVDFIFDLNSKSGTHYATGTLGPTDLQKVNTFLDPTAFVHVKQGKLNEAYFNFEADTAVAIGSMEFLYNDLKVSVLSKKEEKQGTDKAFETFLANAFVISSNNPTLFSTREGGIFIERDTSRSIINYWAKAFLSGVVSSIGARSNKDKIKEWQDEVYERNTIKQTGTNEEQ